jgi:hypothetical protein
MMKALQALSALLILTSCTTAANLKATPLKEQDTAQVESDRARCNEWSKKTAVVLAGFASCLVAAGFEVTPQVGSTSQTLRLSRLSTATDPTRVLLDVLDCDAQARREAERDLGTTSRWIRANLVSLPHNTRQRRQVFVDCIQPRGYDVGKS